ncbi:MAG: DUF4197 domain-containing protein [Rhodocyclaceae bacterium]|nr:DUF4197 domain-containing protein [Rhodocyclaceae bacterium]MBX3669221.1 DUF4197 domain-containing protein [Rhodocyclaceae bacterium]
MRRFLSVLLLAFAVTLPAHAFSLADISNQDAAGGLKEALTQGAGKAVDVLGRKDGFLGNAKVKIPLPGGLEEVAGIMRGLGMRKQVEELEVAMNRAAEAAVPEAKALLVGAVKQMSVQDAKTILTGGDTAATDFFKGKTEAPLTVKFLPIVKNAIGKVKLAEKYEQFAGKASKFGVIKKEDSHLENYVTRKALDGLFLMIGEEERAIRKDPVGAAGGLAKKVFGALGH